MTELMVLPSDKKGIEQVFIEGQNIDSTITKIREEAKNLPIDMSVRKNREEVASFAYKIARSKTAVDKAGAALSAEYKEIPKKIDANRRIYKEAFERLQEEVRKPVNEWEQAEKERVQRHEQQIELIKQSVDLGDDPCSATITAAVESLDNLVIDETWEEFETEAYRAKRDCLKKLQDQLEKRKKYEAEQTELEQLRKAAAEQAQKDREAQVAREAAEQARQAEIDRQAAEAKRIEDDRLKREANTKHKGAINRQALADLVENAGITEDQAKLVVKCIAKGLISNVTINY